MVSNSNESELNDRQISGAFIQQPSQSQSGLAAESNVKSNAGRTIYSESEIHGKEEGVSLKRLKKTFLEQFEGGDFDHGKINLARQPRRPIHMGRNLSAVIESDSNRSDTK